MSVRTVIRNAAIWTADPDNPQAEALVIHDRDIEFVGTEAEAVRFCREHPAAPGDVVSNVDLRGQMVMPAMLDSHTHAGTIAKSMWCLLLEPGEYASMDEVMQIVKTYAEEHPKEEVPYIYAYSCPTHLIDEEEPDRYFMDRYISDRPVLLCDANYHRCLVNSCMLELMEIDETVPYDETNSKNYERFDDNTPNGIIEERVHEFNHDIDKMFEKIGWFPPKESDPMVLASVLDLMNRYGICAVHDGFNDSEDILVGLKALEEQDRLHMYYNVIPPMNTFADLEDAIRTAKEWQDKYADEYIRVDSVKIFLDGTNELATGAYLEPLITDPNNFGIINMSENELVTTFLRLNQEHLNAQIHMVGDRSFRTALNAVERAKAEEAKAGRAFDIHITFLHCELTHPDDRKRPAELGIYINFTPIWAAGLFGEASKQYLGEERYNSMYAFREMIETGAVVNFSSDLVDEEGLQYLNPFIGVEIGHTRVDEPMMGTDIPRAPAEEGLALEDLLYGYTLGNAKGMGIDALTGSLAAGKRANLCVLNQDPFTVPENQIRNTEPVAVMFEGKMIRGRLG